MKRANKAGNAVLMTFFLLVMTVPGSALAQSYRECQDYAITVADESVDTGSNVATGSVAGLVGGIGVGALIEGGEGALVGAAVGTGVGALAGVAVSDSQWDRIYYAAYNDCRNGFPDETPASFTGAPPWSPQWMEYCREKYKTFNPETGHYTAYSGQQKFCVYQGG